MNREVDARGNCSKCGGTHYGSRMCPMENQVSNNPIMKYFDFAHLPPHLQAVSGEVYALAHSLNALVPDGPEKSAGLRKLLEAKDCFVRAALP